MVAPLLDGTLPELRLKTLKSVRQLTSKASKYHPIVFVNIFIKYSRKKLTISILSFDFIFKRVIFSATLWGIPMYISFSFMIKISEKNVNKDAKS